MAQTLLPSHRFPGGPPLGPGPFTAPLRRVYPICRLTGALEDLRLAAGPISSKCDGWRQRCRQTTLFTICQLHFSASFVLRLPSLDAAARRCIL
ncbi:hypothetical protein AAFF_G00086750 [Aldrovandia affinis]|uniref:Uncharacterized protein n=1 Tax=Aldrovandia affinis TaxID=143900 RepID=A0AAD7WCP6_9TELE|nr:hypothetical protein AAFF_G00086750 [Aldrovandia affinis]